MKNNTFSHDISEKKLSLFINDLTSHHPNIPFETNALLAPYTSLKIGGPAQLLIKPTTLPQLITAYTLAHQHQLPVTILGSGTNVLIADTGIKGVTIINKVKSIQTNISPNQAKFRVSSGTPLSYFVQHTIKLGYIDLAEFISVPGTIGGAVWNNAHFKNKLIGTFINQVTTVSPTGQTVQFTQQQAQFGYDQSVFQANNHLIISATFNLIHKVTPQKASQLLHQHIKYRQKTQPLGQFSTGCIFQNLTSDQQKKLNLPTPSTGYLIDQAGLKNTRIGDAYISPVHANFFVHTGHASAADFYKLIQLVKKTIKNKYGVNLKEEIKLLGFT